MHSGGGRKRMRTCTGSGRRRMRTRTSRSRRRVCTSSRRRCRCRHTMTRTRRSRRSSRLSSRLRHLRRRRRPQTMHCRPLLVSAYTASRRPHPPNNLRVHLARPGLTGLARRLLKAAMGKAAARMPTRARQRLSKASSSSMETRRRFPHWIKAMGMPRQSQNGM